MRVHGGEGGGHTVKPVRLKLTTAIGGYVPREFYGIFLAFRNLGGRGRRLTGDREAA